MQTEVDAFRGEALRLGQDTASLARQTGYAKADIERGLQPAIDEFIQAHYDEWRVERVDRNNNGLTVLARIQSSRGGIYDAGTRSAPMVLSPSPPVPKRTASVLVLGSGAPSRACTELALIESAHTLVDPDTRRVLLSTPKGGATVAAQLFFRLLGLTAEALAYSPWVHDYKMDRFNRRPGGHVDPCVACRPDSGWTCVKIVRLPLARVVSSYVHTVRNRALFGSFPELTSEQGEGSEARAPFGTFVRALERRAMTLGRSPFDDHFMPQTSQCDLEAPPLLLPLETLEEGLQALARHTGLALDADGLDSDHYVSRPRADRSAEAVQTAPQAEGSVRAASTADERRTARTMSEEAQRLLNTSSELRHSLCCLYRKDVALYRQACAQAWLLEGCPRCADQCARDVSTLRTHCSH